jgi:Protein of unknown function (DUF1364)
MGLRIATLRDSARTETCTHCGADDGTIVWAHSNALAHGRGASFKAHDLMGAYLCHRCHDLVDGRAGALTKQQKRFMFIEAWAASMVRLIEKGFFDGLR